MSEQFPSFTPKPSFTNVAKTEPKVEADSHGEADQPEVSGSKPAGKTRPRPAGKPLDKATVRRVATKMLELETANDSTLEVVASLLGSSTDLVELTVAVMTADRSSLQPIKDIQDTFKEAADDPIMAVLGLNAASAAQVKAMWSVMNAVKGMTGAMPSNERAALNALFKSITGMQTRQQELLSEASQLLRRA